MAYSRVSVRIGSQRSRKRCLRSCLSLVTPIFLVFPGGLLGDRRVYRQGEPLGRRKRLSCRSRMSSGSGLESMTGGVGLVFCVRLQTWGGGFEVGWDGIGLRGQEWLDWVYEGWRSVPAVKPSSWRCSLETAAIERAQAVIYSSFLWQG